MITLAELEKMFRKMRASAVWNVDGDLSWAYIFTDPQAEKLKPVAEELVAAGYRFAGLYLSRSGAKHVLRVERVETHTPQSLHERNLQLYRLAARHGIASYEGMEVGPPPQTGEP